MRSIIKNGELRVEIDSLGAELKSVCDVDTEREYLWQADPMYWKRTSPVLFPLVGNYFEKQSIYKGKIYEMSQHGFARDMEFQQLSKSGREVWYELLDNEETREKYPFAFRLQIGYRLEGRSLKVMWKVENTNGEKMYFSIGAHPAFNCSLDRSYLTFDSGRAVFLTQILGSDGCLSGREDELFVADGRLYLDDDLFSEDALILEGRQTQSVTLWRIIQTEEESHEEEAISGQGEVVERIVKVDFDSDLVGLWSPANMHAPFMCIEPWYGRADREGFHKKLEEREYGNSLEPGQVFDASYTMTFGPE
ncbi:MAG: aldose 1-epimerase family protein [Lachnospiraceae bacterium]|nr:aldose 1-epimerase family protein [Lachnospiraceae bacterium]